MTQWSIPMTHCVIKFSQESAIKMAAMDNKAQTKISDTRKTTVSLYSPIK
jgi:hypothetical protein